MLAFGNGALKTGVGEGWDGGEPRGGSLSPVAVIPHIYLQCPLGNRNNEMDNEKSEFMLHLCFYCMHIYVQALNIK